MSDSGVLADLERRRGHAARCFDYHDKHSTESTRRSGAELMSDHHQQQHGARQLSRRELCAYVPCRNFARGHCSRGASCWYFHGQENAQIPSTLNNGSSRPMREHRRGVIDVDNMSYEEILELQEEIGFVRVGVPEEQLQQLQTIRLRSDAARPAPCSICLESFCVGEHMKFLPCSHTFHPDCIDPWLREHKHCPNCKSEVVITVSAATKPKDIFARLMDAVDDI